MAQKFKIYIKQKDSNGNKYCIGVQDGKLVLAIPDSGDSTQKWEKEDKGNGNFHIVCNPPAINKVVKFHGKGEQLTLVTNPSNENEDPFLLWGQGLPDNDGYATITAPALNMVMDGGNVQIGTMITIYPMNTPVTENQLWEFKSVV